MTAEHGRLREADERGVPWRKWGPYLRDCASPGARERSDGDRPLKQDPKQEPWVAWGYQSSADGPAGICDDQMRLCFGIAIRGGNDCSLQERLLVMPVTRRCSQADNLPTHSYIRARQRYLQRGMAPTSRDAACFDVVVEYAKSSPEEILIQLEIKNTGQETATLQVLPQLWLGPNASAVASSQAVMERAKGGIDVPCLAVRHPALGSYYLHCELAGSFLFTGTRAAAHYMLILAPRGVQRIRMLLTDSTASIAKPSLDKLFASLKQHRQDANEFFTVVTYACDSPAGAFDARGAFCKMLWNKAVWMSAVTGWSFDRRPSAERPGVACGPASFRLEVAQVVASPDKRECPHVESPVWLLHTLALACIDADLAARQLQSLLSGTLKHRSSGVVPIHHEWQALKPWAALLMYRLQRPRRPRYARADLANNFEALSAQTAGGGWAAIHAQSMLDIALELALHDARYEQRAIECYVMFVAAVAALDCEATLLDTPCEEADDDPGLRLVVSDRMHFQVLSSLGSMALNGAVAFRAGALVGLPKLRERVRSIHREHADRICRPTYLRGVLHRVFGALGGAVWQSWPAGMLLLRALWQIDSLYGRAIRVRCPSAGGAMLSCVELSQWIIRQHVSARVAEIHRDRLLGFCENVYERGAANAGQNTGWAGRAAAMICASWSYSPFDGCGLPSTTTIEHARSRESKAQVAGLKLIRR